MIEDLFEPNMDMFERQQKKEEIQKGKDAAKSLALRTLALPLKVLKWVVIGLLLHVGWNLI